MKNKFKIFFLTATSALLLGSCIEETFPEGASATAEQISTSASALESSLNGIPAQMAQGYYIYGNQTSEIDMGYPALMIEQSEFLGDFYPAEGGEGYDHYQRFNHFSSSFNENSYASYVPWYTLYKFIKAANSIIGQIDLNDENLSEETRAMAGMAYACRAFYYYMLTIYYEPVANRYTDCSAVLGLTVPIITEATTEEVAKNNPRASHDDMIAFILSDCQKAEECLDGYVPAVENRMLPGLAVVYGIMAKTYLWDEDYANAATYARKSIDTATKPLNSRLMTAAKPMTEDEWLNMSSAFNTATKGWMWYIHYDAENMGNLCNFIGWISGEADWGYASLTQPCIDKSLYDKISETDFRKYAFLDPDKYKFYNYQSPRGTSFIDGCPDYMSLKFRCVNGDYKTYSVGGVADVPIMRIEEMYLIEAEAVGVSQGLAAGIEKLNSFMQTYRQEDYSCRSKDVRSFQLEVLTQMRIEFWGEGNAFPSAKRLKPNIIQNYNGTNAPSDVFKINCEGIKPNWNMVIPIYERQSNAAIEGHNNPDPTAAVKGPTPVGEFAQ